jgi:hypothetical protein
MKVLNSHKSNEINDVAADSIEKKCCNYITDKSTGYEDFYQLFETHLSFKSDKKTTLKWVHITISNAKRNLLSVYHMIKIEYLQNYLNEFCFRLNRRYFGERLFDRMAIAIVGN